MPLLSCVNNICTVTDHWTVGWLDRTITHPGSEPGDCDMDRSLAAPNKDYHLRRLELVLPQAGVPYKPSQSSFIFLSVHASTERNLLRFNSLDIAELESIFNP